VEKHTLGSTWEQKIKAWLLKRLLTKKEQDILAMYRAGYKPFVIREQRVDTVTLSSQVVLNDRDHAFLATEPGQLEYDVIYGLTRQLADELKKYVVYKESYDPMFGQWTCRIDLKVVK